MQKIRQNFIRILVTCTDYPDNEKILLNLEFTNSSKETLLSLVSIPGIIIEKKTKICDIYFSLNNKIYIRIKRNINITNRVITVIELREIQ